MSKKTKDEQIDDVELKPVADTGKLFDFTVYPLHTDGDAFQAYYRMRRIAHQLKDNSWLPDGRVMSEDEVAAVLAMAPKKNAAVTEDSPKGGEF